jgi:hypothetical protein
MCGAVQDQRSLLTKVSRFWIAVGGLLFAAALHAQEIAGTWQGTLKADKNLRMILQIERDGSNGRKAKVLQHL